MVLFFGQSLPGLSHRYEASSLASRKQIGELQALVRKMPIRVTGVWFMSWLGEPLSVMSHPYINEPKYWRERAEEARSIAQLLNDQEAKRQLLAIAARYDRLADHIKQRRNSRARHR